MTNQPTNGLERTLQLEVQAYKLLDLIQMRCLQVHGKNQQAHSAFFEALPANGSATTVYSPAENTQTLTLALLNRHLRHWKVLLPQDAGVRAALIRLIAQKYPLKRDAYRTLQAALGLEDPGVQSAYTELYQLPIESVYSQGVEVLSETEIDPEAARSTAFAEIAGDWDLPGEEDELEWVTLPGGAVLYRQDDLGDALFIVVSGRLRSIVRQGDEESRVHEFARGEVIGEMEVLSAEPRATTVTAMRDSELIRISQADIERLAAEHPGLMTRVLRDMSKRLKSQMNPVRQIGNTLVTFALVRDGAGLSADRPAFTGTGLEDFICRLADGLSALGPTLLLNSEQVEAAFGQGWSQAGEADDSNRWLAAYLNEQEAAYRYVIYEADAGPTAWTRRCLRQADRVLVLAESGDDPAPGEVESLMYPPAESPLQDAPELVLIHPDATLQPANTRAWLRRRTVRAHHHVRRTNAEDLQRMIRRLTGRAVGLVMSGGGARGYAHLGVMRALKEAGITVDVVGGASMGSIIAAIHALELPEEKKRRLVRKFSSPFGLFDPTLPLVSFFKSQKLTDVLQDVFGDIRIEDLWRPYFCVSSDLTHARTRVHSDGLLWEAVRASSAIPGIFSPVLVDGELLVDGAVLNNLPIDLMQDFPGCGPMIGVNVFPEVDLERDYGFGHSVSGWQVLFQKLNPLSKDFPAPLIFENILRVISLNDVHQAKSKSQLCDLYITPAVERFGLLEFQSYDRIIEIGYRSAVEAIEAWSRKSPGKELQRERPSSGAADAPATRLGQSLQELEAVLERLALAEPELVM